MTKRNNEKTKCQDGRDNDGDSLVDEDDPGCLDVQDKTERNFEIECDDGVDNDEDGKEDRPIHLSCCSENNGSFVFLWIANVSETAKDVFHHHDCPIHQHPDTDRYAPERHKISGNPEHPHSDDGNQGTER